MDGKLICLLCFVIVINYVSVGNGIKGQNNVASSKKEKTRYYKRVGVNSGRTDKKIQAHQIMRSIQLGIKHSLESLPSRPKDDLLQPDFDAVDTTVFPRAGSRDTPRHRYPEFTFKSYAPIVFHSFRTLYEIQLTDYKTSFCSSPLRELSNPGRSGSKFYITQDDKYMMKTLEPKEIRFLQKSLSEFHSNFNENPSTLLPKIVGLYRYQQSSKNRLTRSVIRRNKNNFILMAMNNLLPSSINIHEKYDLKGSTHKRKASKNENKKPLPTYKDLDFKKKHPDGFYLEPDTYKNLTINLQRDCRFLKSFKIIDYSLLIGVHYVNRVQETKNEQSFKELHKSVRVQNDNSPKGSIPALSGKGEKLLLFVGIIDALEVYGFKKKLEHAYKATLHDGNTVSVHRPRFYAARFLNFMTKSVFKKLSGPLK